MSNFGSFSYFQTSLSLGVEQGLQKLPKFDINDLKLLFHCYILIPRKCPRETPFKTQCRGVGRLIFPSPNPNTLKLFDFQNFLRSWTSDVFLVYMLCTFFHHCMFSQLCNIEDFAFMHCGQTCCVRTLLCLLSNAFLKVGLSACLCNINNNLSKKL